MCMHRPMRSSEIVPEVDAERLVDMLDHIRYDVVDLLWNHQIFIRGHCVCPVHLFAVQMHSNVADLRQWKSHARHVFDLHGDVAGHF